jgi:hypothetical protein
MEIKEDGAGVVVKIEQGVAPVKKEEFPAKIFTGHKTWPWPLLTPGLKLACWKTVWNDEPVVNHHWNGWHAQADYFVRALCAGSKLQCQWCEELFSLGSIHVARLKDDGGADALMRPPVLCYYCLCNFTEHDEDRDKNENGTDLTLEQLWENFDESDKELYLCQVCGRCFDGDGIGDTIYGIWNGLCNNTCGSCNCNGNDESEREWLIEASEKDDKLDVEVFMRKAQKKGDKEFKKKQQKKEAKAKRDRISDDKLLKKKLRKQEKKQLCVVAGEFSTVGVQVDAPRLTRSGKRFAESFQDDTLPPGSKRLKQEVV